MRLAAQVKISPRDIDAARDAIDELKALPTRQIAELMDRSESGSALIDLGRGALKDIDLGAMHVFDSVIGKGIDVGAIETIQTDAARHVLDSVGVAKLAGPYWAKDNTDKFRARGCGRSSRRRAAAGAGPFGGGA